MKSMVLSLSTHNLGTALVNFIMVQITSKFKEPFKHKDAADNKGTTDLSVQLAVKGICSTVSTASNLNTM